MSDPPPNEPEEAEAPAGDGSGDTGEYEGSEDWRQWRVSEETAEDAYKRRVAIVLAGLALLGAWIAVLQTNASTNESATTREATRLASEAESGAVLEQAVTGAYAQAQAEADALTLRSVFSTDQEIAAEAGIDLDPERSAQRLAEAEMIFDEAFENGDPDLRRDIAFEASRRSLAQEALVEERVTWNARASQYETVMTVLAVAIFLVAFTLIVSRKIRPPIALPGLILAVFCFGWAIHIYNKPIPDTPDRAIEATATGEAELELGRPAEAVAAFTEAVEVDDDYQAAAEGRGLANLVLANPDLLNTRAFTGTDSEEFDAAVDDLIRALDLGGDEDAVTLTIAGYTALGAGEYDLAAEFLESAVALNELTPGVQFALSAVETARGDEAAAGEWLERAVEQLGPIEATDRNRGLVAEFLTLLEWVAVTEPDVADQARSLAEEVVVGESEVIAGRELTGEAPPDAGLEVAELAWADDELTINLVPVGVADDEVISIVGYERPSEDGPWVQPWSLYYVGPATTGEAQILDAPRACAPVEFRFDLYVEGTFVETVTAPGSPATC